MHVVGIKQIIERALVSYSGVTTSAGGAAGATLVDSNLSIDYDGQTVLITSGSYTGQARDIDGDTSSGTVTPSSAFGGVIVAGTTFLILSGIPAMAEFDDIKGSGWTNENLTTIDALIDAILADTGTDGVVVNTFTATGKGEINAEVDTALNTAIPASPTEHSINERIKTLDDHITADYGATEKAAIDLLDDAGYGLEALDTELGLIPQSGGTTTWNVTALASINAEVDTALNTAIPASPVADSINERVKAIDLLTESGGGGDLAAILVDTNELQGLIADSKMAAQVKGLDNIDLSATMKTSVNAEVDTALNTAIPGSPTPDSINELIKGLGDFEGMTYFSTLKALLGIPDTDGKPLYTVLVTDLLGHGTHGLAQLEANQATIAGYLTTEVADILTDTATTIPALIAALENISAANVNTEVDNALDTVIPGSPTEHSINERIKALDDHITANYDATIAGRIDAAISTRATPAQVNTEVDNALDTAIPGSPTPDSINDRLKDLHAGALYTLDFWSPSQEEVALTGAAGDKGLPSVTIADLPANATIVRAIAMFKFRMIENHTYAGSNALEGAQNIQVKPTAGADTNAIAFVDAQFTIAETTREGGDVIIGAIDIAGSGKVEANGVYDAHWDLALAEETGLNFNDVQMGIRIWYSV